MADGIVADILDNSSPEGFRKTRSNRSGPPVEAMLADGGSDEASHARPLLKSKPPYLMWKKAGVEKDAPALTKVHWKTLLAFARLVLPNMQIKHPYGVRELRMAGCDRV